MGDKALYSLEICAQRAGAEATVGSDSDASRCRYFSSASRNLFSISEIIECLECAVSLVQIDLGDQFVGCVH